MNDKPICPWCREKVWDAASAYVFEGASYHSHCNAERTTFLEKSFKEFKLPDPYFLNLPFSKGFKP